MKTRTIQYLRDALDEAYELQLDLTGLSISTFKRSHQLQRSTERSLEIVGESIRRALDEDEGLRSSHAELREWIALRNIISHQYDKILPEAIWGSATEDVKDLITDLETLLASHADD